MLAGFRLISFGHNSLDDDGGVIDTIMSVLVIGVLDSRVFPGARQLVRNEREYAQDRKIGFAA